jgi:hypothetical protein
LKTEDSPQAYETHSTQSFDERDNESVSHDVGWHIYAIPFTQARSDKGVYGIDYRCDNTRFRLSAHNCQVPTPTSQNLGLEQEIGIYAAE